MLMLARPFIALLRDASVFLDFDGTLVSIAARPDAIVLPPVLPALLDRLATRLGGRLAIVSGRPVAQLATLLGDPSYLLIGSHGAERRAPGEPFVPDPAPDLADIIAAMQAFAAATPGVLVEAKPHGVALHYRAAPHARAAARALAIGLANRVGYTLQPGRMVFEVRVAGSDKGVALTATMTRPGWAGTRPVMIGDDRTDEPAFAAAYALGGAGVLVGRNRRTHAAYRLGGVAAALGWLAAACDARDSPPG